MGFTYMFLLLLQGSLFYTHHHINKKWTLWLETFVLIHGVSTAIVVQGEEAAARFFFGFFAIFLVTQMHGLRFPRWFKFSTAMLYIVLMAVFYSNYTDRFTGPIQIPLMEYILIAGFTFIVWPLVKGTQFLISRMNSTAVE